MEDKQKCNEYRKEKVILNTMKEQKCDIYEAKKILGIERGKTYARITKEKRINTRRNQNRKEEINTTETKKRAVPKTGKNTIMESTQGEELEKKYKEPEKPKTKCKESKIREKKREKVHSN